MADNKGMTPGMTEKKKQEVLEYLWLTYFNDTLYAEGLITEDQRNKMRIKIKNRSSAKSRQLPMR